jgi:hypothetical protein
MARVSELVMRPTWVRKSIVSTVVLIVIGILYLAGQAWTDRNRGQDAACPHFLKMSPSERAEVIEKMGYNPRYVTKRQQVAHAVHGCVRALGTSDEDDALKYILGP